MKWSINYSYSDAAQGGKLVATNNSALYIPNLPATTNDSGGVAYGGFNCNPGDYVILTGVFAYYDPDGTFYFQTTGGGFISVKGDKADDGNWRADGRGSAPMHTESQAQYLVNKIINNNKLILQNNLLCARYANKLTKEQQQRVRDLQIRLSNRNEELTKEGLVKNVETSYPSGYSDLEPYLAKLMNYESIGIATWAVIVIACTVIAGLGTAAYYTYKSLADESEQDVKYSKELTKVLVSKLTEEEYQQLLNETKGIVTKAKIRQAVGSYWNVLKYVAFVAAGFVGYKFIQKYVVS